MTSLGRVLVVDDEPEVRDLLRDVLTEAGYAVKTAASGVQALTTIPSFEPDLILLDLQMPGLTGVEVLGHVRVRYPALRVVVVTANSDVELARHLLGHGAFDYIAKPFEVRHVEHTVAAAIAVSLTA
jgi:CheY-like chemotaxis protein